MQEEAISLKRLFVFLLLIKVNNTAYSITLGWETDLLFDVNQSN